MIFKFQVSSIPYVELKLSPAPPAEDVTRGIWFLDVSIAYAKMCQLLQLI